MEPREVVALIAGGESLEVEFKRKANDDTLVEMVVCLANASGGHLLVGVDDDGTIVGASRRHGARTDEARLQAMIANRTAPPVVVEPTVVVIDGADVLVVAVEQASGVVSTTGGLYLRRAIDVHGRPRCMPLLPHERLGRAGSIGAIDPSIRAVPGASMMDLDPSELGRFRSLAGRAGDRVLADLADDDLVDALGLRLDGGALTVGALLLFGRETSLERFLPTHETMFQVVEDLAVVINRCGRQPLLRAMDELITAINAYNPEEEVEDGLQRIGLPRYASDALRELVANALLHRDYAAPGAVRVAIEDETLSVANPGGGVPSWHHPREPADGTSETAQPALGGRVQAGRARRADRPRGEPGVQEPARRGPRCAGLHPFDHRVGGGAGLVGLR